MTGKPQIFMQSVATVLPFAPPGLLLVATFLQLRKSPVNRLLSTIRAERLQLSQVAGRARNEEPPNLADTPDLQRALRSARRSGRDITSRLAIIEDNLQKLRDEEQELADVFAGLCARTALALTFTLILIMIMKTAGTTRETNASQIAATGTACSGLMFAGVLLPLGGLRRAITDLDVTASTTMEPLVRWLLDAEVDKKDQLARTGVTDPMAAAREGDQFFRELRKKVRSSLAKATRMTSIYEVLTLAPSSALLVAGNWF